MNPPLVVGSEDAITGTIFDWVEGAQVEMDLTGMTLAVKIAVNGGAAEGGSDAVVAGTPDPDQGTNTGKFSASLTSTTLTQAGHAEIQVHYTIGGKTRKTGVITRTVARSV